MRKNQGGQRLAARDREEEDASDRSQEDGRRAWGRKKEKSRNTPETSSLRKSVKEKDSKRGGGKGNWARKKKESLRLFEGAGLILYLEKEQGGRARSSEQEQKTVAGCGNTLPPKGRFPLREKKKGAAKKQHLAKRKDTRPSS